MYEILTGEKAQQFPERTPHMIAQVVCQTEPAAPAALDRGSGRRFGHHHPHGDAERTAAALRFGGGLAHDIRLHLEGYPVAARADTMAYRTAKFLRRNRAPAAMAAMTVVLVGGAALAYWVGATERGPPRVTRDQTDANRPRGQRRWTGSGWLLRVFVDGLSGKRLLARVPIEGGPLQTLPVTLDPPRSWIFRLTEPPCFWRIGEARRLHFGPCPPPVARRGRSAMRPATPRLGRPTARLSSLPAGLLCFGLISTAAGCANCWILRVFPIGSAGRPCPGQTFCVTRFRRATPALRICGRPAAMARVRIFCCGSRMPGPARAMSTIPENGYRQVDISCSVRCAKANTASGPGARPAGSWGCFKSVPH